MKEPFWKSDRFVGLVISLGFLLAGSSLLSGLDQFVYDFGIRSSDRKADKKAQIAVVAIDDKSIENLGRWPWPRSTIATMVDRLRDAGAKVVGLPIFFTEPQTDPGLVWIQRISGELNALQLPADAGRNLSQTLTQAEQELNVDGRLADSFSGSGKVVLAMQFELGIPVGRPDEELPEYLTRFAIPEENVAAVEGSGSASPLETVKAFPPIEEFGSKVLGIGHLAMDPNAEAGLRREPLVVRYYDQYFPSLSLMLAAASLNLSVKDIHINLGESVRLGGLTIRTDLDSRMNTFFYGEHEGRKPFPVDSFFDVMKGDLSLDKYKDKIVLVGPTAFGVGSVLDTPLGQLDGAVLPLAHAVASILNEDFVVNPYWSGTASLLITLLIAAYLIFVLPRLRATPAFVATLALFVVLLGSELGILIAQATWIPLMNAAALLLVGHLLLTTKRFVVTELSKERLDIESSISFKQLAMQYKERGQLDMAFDHFRKCPVDDSLLQNIYDLALDYERKRQFNKATSAYSYIAEKNANFRDIKEKVQRARALEETVLLGGSGAKVGGGTMLLDGSISKPMLGRYQVEKELGKGAMGVVYLGRDPKINRVVAIKTMALAQEFEADELEEVKSRFFREAETAGRLQHPNIVTIYDAGEEHDLAYIAMEFLQGHDLVRYTKSDNLLPVSIVMGVIYKAALALDYAHKNNVVHRDIKPANVMYEPEKKQVKLTDFGIARITDSSKTKTGMVLGTPSYMSPEQLSGKKVDGRSDLFSLGVMFYQLLTGSLPFKGDSMATLMYKIANEPHQALSEVRPDLASQKPCINEILNRALHKDLQQRYQTGADMARDIQQCAKLTSGALAG